MALRCTKGAYLRFPAILWLAVASSSQATNKTVAAVCIGGAPRAFVNSVVHGSVWANILGGQQAVRHVMTGFAVFTITSSDNVSGLGSILSRLGIPEHRTMMRARVGRPLLPNCTVSYNATWGEAHPRGCGRACGWQGWWKEMGAFVGQLETRAACYDLMITDEVQHGRRFSSVLFTRPDLLWYRPLATIPTQRFGSCTVTVTSSKRAISDPIRYRRQVLAKSP